MSKVTNVKTAAWYLTKWEEVEDQIAEEYVLLAGVKKADNGSDTLELQNRITELRKMADYYKAKYDEAYENENGGSDKVRLRTYIWGN